MINRNTQILPRMWISEERFLDPSDLEGEIWKDLTEFKGHILPKGYQVSNKGRIRRQDGNIFKGSITFDGYHELALTDCQGKSVYARVHQIVLRFFKGSPPDDMVDPTVQHINCNKLDNRVENLTWMSAFDNNQDGHGVLCKVIDNFGDHVFPSQKMASRYIGRHDDYISEGISHGYRLTNVQGLDIVVSLLDDGNWVQYNRKMPKNRRWCRIVYNSEEIEFESLQSCSTFLKREPSYLGNLVSNGWPLDIEGLQKLELFDANLEKYIPYFPSKIKGANGGKNCQIIDSSGSHVFRSISSAANYIGRDPEYLRIAIRDEKIVKTKDGELVKASIFMKN